MEYREGCSDRLGIVMRGISGDIGNGLDRDKVLMIGGKDFWCLVRSGDLDLPAEFYGRLNEITQVFAHEVLNIENGKIEKVKKSCKVFGLVLREIIFNIKIEKKEFCRCVTDFYNEFHSKKQTVILSLLIDELNLLENTLLMPQSTKKIFKSYSLENSKNTLLTKYLTQDSINPQDLFRDFMTEFKPFINKENKPNDNLFENFYLNYNISIKNLYLEYLDKLVQVSRKLWASLSYKITSIYLKPIQNDSIKSSENNEIIIAQLILSDCSPKLNSITQISRSKIIICIYDGLSSFLILVENSNSYILKIFQACECICAEGSNETHLLIFNKTTFMCEIFLFVDNNLNKITEFSLIRCGFNYIDCIGILDKEEEIIVFTCRTGKLGVMIERRLVKVIMITETNDEKFLYLRIINGKIFVLSDDVLKVFDSSVNLMFKIETGFFVCGFISDSNLRLNVIGFKDMQLFKQDTEITIDELDDCDDEIEEIKFSTTKINKEDYFLCNITNYNKLIRSDFQIIKDFTY